jgi:hypothetical protein
MIVKVDLHMRASQSEDHRPLGMVPVEIGSSQLAPHQEIACWLDGRRLRAQITSLHQRGCHLPRVYADEMPADELV